ncbi:hypothetical protein SLNWT_0173 [Streptomyces albus]|uniref:Uncharacterized protein n=1 Tax=Streptomyces albus (strain ATCC 21838 / DSM 41398 / FERM P-419 / JCM 4703 / NBRC 107858) TaxID=1081613 RepID=A0A0B5EGR1_STRA4|nr:hypothetical protein SLNWT_0173 [Streptomyces albus]
MPIDLLDADYTPSPLCLLLLLKFLVSGEKKRGEGPRQGRLASRIQPGRRSA